MINQQTSELNVTKHLNDGCGCRWLQKQKAKKQKVEMKHQLWPQKVLLIQQTLRRANDVDYPFFRH